MANERKTTALWLSYFVIPSTFFVRVSSLPPYFILAFLPVIFVSCAGPSNPSPDSKEAEARTKASKPDQRSQEMSTKNSWPFDNPRNAAVVTLKSIVFGDKPILYVAHDADDGGWQFLDGSPVSKENALVVSLEEITRIDQSVLGLADLPPGWYATRSAANAQWQRGIEAP
jgi:hypothetical protein